MVGNLYCLEHCVIVVYLLLLVVLVMLQEGTLKRGWAQAASGEVNTDSDMVVDSGMDAAASRAGAAGGSDSDLLPVVDEADYTQDCCLPTFALVVRACLPCVISPCRVSLLTIVSSCRASLLTICSCRVSLLAIHLLLSCKFAYHPTIALVVRVCLPLSSIHLLLSCEFAYHPTIALVV